VTENIEQHPENIEESNAQDMENLDVKKQRKPLFNLLWHVLDVSTRKFDREKASNVDRQKWARIIISAIQGYGELMKDSELEDIEERLTKLESKQELESLR
jgi:hypothetical protein